MNKNNDPDAMEGRPLSGRLMARLAASLEPVFPAPARVLSLRERILTAAAAEPRTAAAAPAHSHTTLRSHEGRWLELAPGIRMKPLHREHGTLSYLMQFDAGMALPAHDHPQDEECMVLEGDVWLGDTHAFGGDYHLARAGVPHGRIYTEGGCLLFLRGARPELPRVVR